MACDLKVPKTPGAQAGKHACGRCGLIKGGGHLASCGSLLYIKPTAGHVTWGDQASHARPNGHSNFSRLRRPHYITPAGRGETQPKKTLTIASQAKGTAFSVKSSGIFRKSSHHFLPTTIGSTSPSATPVDKVTEPQSGKTQDPRVKRENMSSVRRNRNGVWHA